MSEHTRPWRAAEITSAFSAANPAAEPPATLVNDRPSVRVPAVAPVVFPGYEILGEIGRGGMGVVYKARQRNLNRLVALKVILGGPFASDEDKARFRVEAEAAARLHHPNIVQVYDVGEYAGFSYMALELVEGATLRKWQNGEPVAPRTAARLVSTIARAVHHAHEQGIVHRDLKPANILLAPVAAVQPEFGAAPDAALPTATGLAPPSASGSSPGALDVTPKVTDFGLAKALRGGADLTVTGVACGTPNYMAPEQVRGKPPGPGMDVYGLGAVLFELLTGRPPFVGTDPTEVMNRIMAAEPAGVRALVPTVPRDLAVIVAKCLEKEPHRRYPTARDAADDLDRFLAGAPIAARPSGTAERVWRWGRRNPVAAAFLALSTFGCVLTGGLAAAVATSAADERSARAGAETARSEAESARDGLRGALAATETARQQAEREKRAAALAQEAAEGARARAEDNLRVARWMIRDSMREFARHPRFEEADFREVRVKLIQQVRQFRDTVAAHAPNTPEWLDDLGDVSHFLGYLEYANGNNAAAADEYRTAAGAFGRWALLEPHNTGARARQAFSTLNAGNALRNALRFRDAEGCYREACRLIDAVVADAPGDLNYRHQAVESYGKLAGLLRAAGNSAGWVRASETEAERAEALLRANAAKSDNLHGVAAAQQGLAQKLAALRRWDEADCHFAGAVETRERLRDAARGAPRAVYEHAAALLAHAEFLAARGHPERAEETFAQALAAVGKVHTAFPDVDEPAAELASACSRYADFLHARGRQSDAERAYDRAVELTRAATRRAPWYRPAWEALAGATAGRAHLYNGTGRHRQAAAEWARLAVEDPDPRQRPKHELFVVQSLLFARDWMAAAAAADAQARNVPDWLALERARVWCLIAREIDADEGLAPADKLARGGAAVHKAVAYLERARAFGEFTSPDRVQWFTTHPDFAPARGKFDPQKK
ncbi:MAG: serine/threonine protein kinase [Planctomycetes bacterium]|nr:serine/threonine protein kinase [Planctomycetota bacterium]